MNDKKLELLLEIQKAASELAGYASYSEIVGAITHNRSDIRKWCDKIQELNRKIIKLEIDDIWGINEP